MTGRRKHERMHRAGAIVNVSYRDNYFDDCVVYGVTNMHKMDVL